MASHGEEPPLLGAQASKATASLVAMLVLASCTTTSPDNSKNPPPTSPATGTGTNTPGDSIRLVTLAKAEAAVEGRDYAGIRTRSTQEHGDKTWSVLDVSGDGQVLAVLTNPGQGEQIVGQSLRVEQPDGKILHTIPRIADGPPRQIVSGVLAGRFVVWKETTSTDLYNDQWSMYAFDNETKKTRLVAAQRPASEGPQPLAPGGTAPSVTSDGVLYYSAVDTEDRANPSVQVYKLSLAEDKAPADAFTGFSAVAAGDVLFFLAEAENRVTIHRVNTDGGPVDSPQDVPLDGCKVTGFDGNPSGVAALALRCGAKDEIRLYDTAAPFATISDPRALGYLNLGDEFVWFARASKSGEYEQYLVGLEKLEPLRVGDGTVSGEARVDGRVFSWVDFNQNPGVTIAQYTP